MMTEIKELGAVIFLAQTVFGVALGYGIYRYVKSRKSRKRPTIS